VKGHYLDHPVRQDGACGSLDQAAVGSAFRFGFRSRTLLLLLAGLTIMGL
jgi:hypothetical protein